MSGFFKESDSAVRLMQAGCDILMLCSHWTDTDRSRGFAEAMIEARRGGDLCPRKMERSQERVIRLLGQVPQNEVEMLPGEHFEQHDWTGVLL